MSDVTYQDYEARNACAELFTCFAPEVLIEGPAGTGKSRAVGEYLHYICEQNPGCRLLVLRKTRVSLTESWMVTFETKVLPPNDPIMSGAARANRHVYSYPNGSQIILGGMDNPTRLFSSEYDIAYVNEANELTEEEWESLHRALRNKKIVHPNNPAKFLDQLIGDCNPDSPNHWLNQRCLKGKTKRLVTTHADNPSLTPEYLERLSGLTGVRRLRLYEGKWAQAEGAVYDIWNPDKHVVEPPQANVIKSTLGSIDWGFTHPTVLQVWGLDGDRRMWLLAEVFMSNKTIDWVIEQLRILSVTWGVGYWVADPAEPGLINQCRTAGLSVVEAINDVILGINIVTKRLKVQKDGRPRIVFVKDGTSDGKTYGLRERDEVLVEKRAPWSTTQEFESYVWKKNRDGSIKKDEPAKEFDDGMDAMRYAAVSVEEGEQTGGGALAISATDDWDR